MSILTNTARRRHANVDLALAAAATGIEDEPEVPASSSAEREVLRAPFADGRRSPMGSGLFAMCANPRCSSGWLHLWRSRTTPVFERGWTCSAECTTARVDASVRRELEGGVSDQSAAARWHDVDRDLNRAVIAGGNVGRHSHRIPLGLVMLKQGWITQSQLRKALEAQREAGQGRLGRWLIHLHAATEESVSRALALQWSCPVLSVREHSVDSMAVALPRLFIEAFGALPLKVAGGSLLYLGFAGRMDPILALAMQRMLGLHVETGILPDSLFQRTQAQLLKASFPCAELIEAQSRSVVVRMLAKSIETQKPIDARLVRIHDCLWLRMWLRKQEGPFPKVSEVRDVICSLSGH